MAFLAVIFGLSVGVGFLYLLLKVWSKISDTIKKRRREDNGGRNIMFYTPKTTTELLREFKRQLEDGQISNSTYSRRRRKTINKFKEGYNLNLGYNINITHGTNDAVEHLKQLKIMQEEGLISHEEYNNIYKLQIKQMSKLK